jgi:hypothetical protein
MVELTIDRCGEDIKSLQRFVDAQCTAFRKILKKYRVWQIYHIMEREVLMLKYRNGPGPGHSASDSIARSWAIPKASRDEISNPYSLNTTT